MGEMETEAGTEEVWVDVCWYPDYLISNMGRVMSKTRRIRYSSGVMVEKKGRVLRPCDDSKGYLAVRLYRDRVPKTVRVHRAMLLSFVGNPVPGVDMACHNNGNSLDNRLENLRWDTHMGNVVDRVRHGTELYGEKNHCSKLTDEKVSEILISMDTDGQLAKRFGVHSASIWCIRNRGSWGHIPRRKD